MSNHSLPTSRPPTKEVFHRRQSFLVITYVLHHPTHPSSPSLHPCAQRMQAYSKHGTRSFSDLHVPVQHTCPDSTQISFLPKRSRHKNTAVKNQHDYSSLLSISHTHTATNRHLARFQCPHLPTKMQQLVIHRTQSLSCQQVPLHTNTCRVLSTNTIHMDCPIHIHLKCPTSQNDWRCPQLSRAPLKI